MGKKDKKYTIQLSFEGIELPPFKDILVVGKNSLQGKIGLSKSLELLIPNGFELVEVKDKRVDVVFINTRITKKIPTKKVIKLLAKKVFPHISDGEFLKVNLTLNVSYSPF